MFPKEAVKTVIHFASKRERFPFQAPGMSIVNGYAVGNRVQSVEHRFKLQKQKRLALRRGVVR